MQLTLSVKCTYHHKNASYFVNFTENHTKSTLSSSLHIFLNSSEKLHSFMTKRSKICATEACSSTNRSKLLGSTTDNVSCIPFITYTCKT